MIVQNLIADELIVVGDTVAEQFMRTRCRIAGGMAKYDVAGGMDWYILNAQRPKPV